MSAGWIQCPLPVFQELPRLGPLGIVMSYSRLSQRIARGKAGDVQLTVFQCLAGPIDIGLGVCTGQVVPDISVCCDITYLRNWIC